jgi:hypothetical protein
MLVFPVELQHGDAPWESDATGWFHGIDVLVVNAAHGVSRKRTFMKRLLIEGISAITEMTIHMQ